MDGLADITGQSNEQTTGRTPSLRKRLHQPLAVMFALGAIGSFWQLRCQCSPRQWRRRW